MTVRELIINGRNTLNKGSIENAQNEVYFIAEKVFHKSRAELMFIYDSETDESLADEFNTILEKRLSGTPLQYCIGEWDFYGNTYKVGEGVLIPRPETEELCTLVLSELKNIAEPTVIDLCSGSGCIGLTVKSNIPDATVFLVEKSRDAIRYLIENANTVCKNQFISIVNGDVLKPENFEETFEKVDAIVSNPPYIRSCDIDSLQSEVQLEPKMALDGGEDGYDFYRVICKEWHRYLKSGGFIALECGEEQAEYICNLFDSVIFETEIFKDFNGIDRFVIGRKKNL